MTYQTEQRSQLLAFLKKHRDCALTIDAIASGMQADPDIVSPPGKSTLYRLMPKLMDENLVTCFAKSSGGKSSYQLIAGQHCHCHMHLKCTDCGKLLHMSDEASDRLLSQVRAVSGFDLDMDRTLLFGLCEICKKKGTTK